MIRLLDQILNTIFPRCCPLCGQLSDTTDAAQLCPDCASIIAQECRKTCPLCHHPATACTCIPTALHGMLSTVGKRSILSVGFYESGQNTAFARLMFQLKNQADDTAAHIFARMLSLEILRSFTMAEEDIRTWIITYPPRTQAARSAHGFDQARRLAKMCAQYTGAQFADVFTRKRGEEQKTLPIQERKTNAYTTLKLKNPKSWYRKKLIICDDIITTGATIAACASLLREAGASEVLAASALRTRTRIPEKDALWFAQK